MSSIKVILHYSKCITVVVWLKGRKREKDWSLRWGKAPEGRPDGWVRSQTLPGQGWEEGTQWPCSSHRIHFLPLAAADHLLLGPRKAEVITLLDHCLVTLTCSLGYMRQSLTSHLLALEILFQQEILFCSLDLKIYLSLQDLIVLEFSLSFRCEKNWRLCPFITHQHYPWQQSFIMKFLSAPECLSLNYRLWCCNSSNKSYLQGNSPQLPFYKAAIIYNR